MNRKEVFFGRGGLIGGRSAFWNLLQLGIYNVLVLHVNSRYS